MKNKSNILVIEDDPTFRSLIVTILEDDGYNVVEEEDGKKALEKLRKRSFDLVISDLRLPSLDGLSIFRKAKEEGILPPFILITAFGTIEEAVSAIKEGVTDFLTKPLKDPDTLRAIVKKTLENHIQQKTLSLLKEQELAGIPSDEVLFAGSIMGNIRDLIEKVADTPTTVLITGESGTGKELIAKKIHFKSKRNNGPFVAINCAAIPDNLMESELFGYEKGAFTGATQSKPGKFELASGGTFFLDEIGELSLSLQAKLLRFLQEKTFERIGGQRQIQSDVRIIAATNRNLLKEIEEKRFREDLYYRLSVFPIHIPSLRERIDGLEVIVDYLVVKIARQLGKNINSVDSEVYKVFKKYDWPGNIRELKNVIERAVILSDGKITLNELPDNIKYSLNRLEEQENNNLENIEKKAIIEMLKQCNGNRRLTAKRLGISRRTLQYKLKKYGLINTE